MNTTVIAKGYATSKKIVCLCQNANKQLCLVFIDKLEFTKTEADNTLFINLIFANVRPSISNVFLQIQHFELKKRQYEVTITNNVVAYLLIIIVPMIYRVCNTVADWMSQ